MSPEHPVSVDAGH